MLYAIVGPMFSEKTRHLIARCGTVAAEHGAESVVALVPSLDTRSGAELRAHSGERCTAYAVATLDDLRRVVYPRPDLRLVAVDEVQMFDPGLLRELVLLARRGLEVWGAGLLHDYRGAPFENTTNLITLADRVFHAVAHCAVCGGPAAWTHRKAAGGSRIQVGGAEAYEARCRRHWEEVVQDRWEPEGVPLGGVS